MMNNGRTPFAYRAAMAVPMKNADAANEIIAEALTEVGNKVRIFHASTMNPTGRLSLQPCEP